MTGDETENWAPSGVTDDAPTQELKALTEADIAALEAAERLEANIADEGIVDDKIEHQLQEATKKNAELTALLRQRDEELIALRAALAAKSQTEEKASGATEARPAPAQPRHEFEPGETRKLVRRDAHASHSFAVTPGRVSLGSAADNDIRIEDAFISRHHAQIVSSSGESVLKDLNSLNGTYVNARKVSRCALRDGDSITVGKLSFTFVTEGKTAPAIRALAGKPAPEHDARPHRGSWK
jgi:hypothetical protein